MLQRYCFVVSVLFLVGWPVSASAQSAAIEITVIDAYNGALLPRASVVLTSDDGTVQAGTPTAFGAVVTGLGAGSYSLEVSHEGYESHILGNIRLADGERMTLTVRLVPLVRELDPLVVSASRRAERALDAPADVSVLEGEALSSRATPSPEQHLKGLPAVDATTMGLNQTTVTVRGFSNVLDRALFALVDHRIVGLASARFNYLALTSLTDSEIDRVEVISGPASAMYGPNSASGVVHYLTSSTLDERGSTVRVSGGERSLFMVSASHTGRVSEDVGYRVSAQHMRGDDWTAADPLEPDSIAFHRQDLNGRHQEGPLFLNTRDFHVERTTANGRVDLRLQDDLTLTISGGHSSVTNLLYGDFGAAQLKGWSYGHAQARLSSQNFFAQTYVNFSGGGDSYLRRTGDLLVDHSKLVVGQVQHSISLGDRQRLDYGADGFFTFPSTEHSQHGRNEDDDDIREVGAYANSTTRLSDDFSLVAALRVDDHSRLDGPILSPRGALLFAPAEGHRLRFTFNRAFASPTSLNFSADILAGAVPSPLPPPFPSTLMAFRALGVPHQSGFTFQQGTDGRPLMLSQFGAGMGYLPMDANSVWPVLRQVLIGGFDSQSQGLLETHVPQALATQVPGQLMTVNLATGGFDPTADFGEVRPLRESTSTTFEMGYRGVFQDRFGLNVAVYHTRIDDFVSPLIAVTPHVFLDAARLRVALDASVDGIAGELEAGGASSADARDQAEAMIDGLSAAAAQLPIGVISPNEVMSDTDVILTYRNFGDVSVTGLDLSLSYYFPSGWSVHGNYSFVNKDFFQATADQPFSIALNSPKHKAGGRLEYASSDGSLDGYLRGRHVAGFPVNSGVFVGDVEAFTVVDAGFGVALPFSPGTRLGLNVQNLLDNAHREFVGTPEIGRLAILSVEHSF